jgi:hypothetical protein
MIGRLLLGAALAALATHAGAAERPSVDGLEGRRDGERVLVSFRVSDAFSEDTLERVESGLRVTFRHRIEILGRRTLGIFPPRVLAKTVVETTVEYDSLTRQYALSRTTTRRTKRKKDAPEPAEEASTTDSSEEMRRWMSELRGVPVFDPAHDLTTGEPRLRVESTIGRRYVMLIFPASISASAELRLGE